MSKRDEEASDRAELTRVATARVTWEAAAAIAANRAASAFLQRQSNLAEALRDMADAFKTHAATESAAQDKLLRKLGMR